MAKNLQDARERLEAEKENPFQSAISRLKQLTKSNDKEEELEDEDDLSTASGVDEEEELEDEDEDEYEDDEDEDEDEEDEEVEKSLKSSRRSQTAAVSSADQAEAHQSVKRAKNARATDPATNVHGKVAHHFDDLDDDEVDEGEYDFGDDDGDEGDADHTKHKAQLSENSDEAFAPKGAKRGGNRGKGKDQRGWNTHKSEAEEDGEDFGLPEAQEEFLNAVMASPYAAQIDASKALREVATMFGAELARERGIMVEVAKSYEALGDLPNDIAYLKSAVQVLASALTKSITQQEELLGQHAQVMKSLTGVATDIELVKSQPSSGTPMGYMGQPPSRPSTFTPDNSEKSISKHDVHAGLAKSVNEGVMTTDDAANYMASIDTKGVGVVYESLPSEVRARIASH